MSLRDWIVARAKKIEEEDKNSYTHWLEHEAEDMGLNDPPIDAQKALNFLIYYLLGPDWCVWTCESTSQTNSAAVHCILLEHSPKYRRERRRFRRKIMGGNK